MDDSVYPFRTRRLEVDGASLHLVDEGAGRPVLLLHGNPTWSFLHRHVVGDLAGRCRCIAPDLPGFGLSEAPDRFGFTPREHARAVGRVVDELGLEGFVLVGHDWGGPIGLAVAAERPDRVAGLVLCNTWCWRPDLRLRAFSLLVGGPVGRWLCLRRNAFARWIVPLGIHRRDRRTEAVLEAYRAPFPTPESRVPTWVFPRAIRTSAGWIADVEGRLHRLAGRPVELVWGMRDPMLGRRACLERWRRHFPDAGVDRVEDASHYLPEDRPDRLAAAVGRALEAT
ncbi:MAG: alpha/beta fold hydrolase [Gemmatimonadota bacterium]